MSKKWSDFESDGRTMKQLVTIYKSRFMKLKKQEDFDIHDLIDVGDALTRAIKAKHEIAKTYELTPRVTKLEEYANLAKKHEYLLKAYR